MNNAYLNYNEYLDFLKDLQSFYPSLITISDIGKTYENNTIPLIKLSSSNENNKCNSSILFDGMHHSREPVSMMMNLYLLLHLLENPQPILEELLSTTTIYFIPIVNIDGYKLNSETYEKEQSTANCFVRKNRHENKTIKCKKQELGVDLNRNYGLAFAYDDHGSSSNPCDEDYRGPEAFSEPETKAMKYFIEDHPDIKIAINYHTWGNLIITPYNYLPEKESNKLIEKNFPILFQLYKEFEKEANYPPNFLFGNGDRTIKYTANGDASDWMLGERHILAFSPELGNGNKKSDSFYPDKDLTFDILKKNLPSALYTVQKGAYYLKAYLVDSFHIPCYDKTHLRGKKAYIEECTVGEDTTIFIKVMIKNEGMSNYTYRQLSDKIEYNGRMSLNISIHNPSKLCYYGTDKNFTTDEIEDKLVLNCHTIPLKPEDKIQDDTFDIGFDIKQNITSRGVAFYYFKMIITKDSLVSTLKDNTNIAKILSASKAKNSTVNTNSTAQWKFFNPSFDVYFNNITEKTITVKSPKKYMTVRKLFAICLIIAILISFGYMIYYFKNRCKNLGVVKVLDSSTFSQSSRPPSLSDINNQKKTNYIELPGQIFP